MSRTRPKPRRSQQPQGDANIGAATDTSGAGVLPAASWRDSFFAWRWSPFWMALVSGLLVWSALPPLGWWPIGWLAPIGWLVLIERDTLPGRRPYWSIYLASAIFWALTMQGIRLAHWANYLALVAMAAYLGLYVPLFVAVGRCMRHGWRLPLLVVAPVAWVGVEVVRGYGPLGFSMALLGHTQVKRLALIQIADLCGPYTVSFVVMFVAACVARMMPGDRRRWSWWPAVPAATLVGLSLAYGAYRLGEPLVHERAPLRVALVQGSIDTVFDDDRERPWRMLDQYTDLTSKACNELQPLDLVLWPETMFPFSDMKIEGDAPRMEPPWEIADVEEGQRQFRRSVQSHVWRINHPDQLDGDVRCPTHWIFGVATWQFGDYPARRYNSAIWADPEGTISGQYYKMRPVIFGEYVPFGEAIPALYRLFPLPNGLTPGTEPVAWELNGLRLSPSICFESTMPHLMRWQVAELTRRGEAPDVLINLTNDGWFHGSSVLDMQLNCAVFRAVELRRPFLIAANTGFSAWIDGNGVTHAKGPRRATRALLAKVTPDGRRSAYLLWGDLPALSCSCFCLLAALCFLWKRRRESNAPSSNAPSSNAPSSNV